MLHPSGTRIEPWWHRIFCDWVCLVRLFSGHRPCQRLDSRSNPFLSPSLASSILIASVVAGDDRGRQLECQVVPKVPKPSNRRNTDGGAQVRVWSGAPQVWYLVTSRRRSTLVLQMPNQVRARSLSICPCPSLSCLAPRIKCTTLRCFTLPLLLCIPTLPVDGLLSTRLPAAPCDGVFAAGPRKLWMWSANVADAARAPSRGLPSRARQPHSGAPSALTSPPMPSTSSHAAASVGGAGRRLASLEESPSGAPSALQGRPRRWMSSIAAVSVARPSPLLASQGTASANGARNAQTSP